MAHMTPAEVNSWLAETKLSLSTLETDLEKQIASEVLGKLSPVFDTTTWLNESTTPVLVRALIAMYYAAAIYDRQYSDNVDDTTSNYAWTLRRRADANIKGLVEGTITIPESTDNAGAGTPVFYPNDTSSLGVGFQYDKSETPASFSMGQVF